MLRKENRSALVQATREAMLIYLKRGWTGVAVDGKKPLGGKDWHHKATIKTPEDVARLDGHNVGILFGPHSNGLVDIDLDSAEAVIAGNILLPPTNAIFGHASKRSSHHLYRSPDIAGMVGKAALQFQDPDPKRGQTAVTGEKTDHAMMLEVRCGGGGKAAQTVCPPSIHEGTGENISWEPECNGEPAEIDAGELLRCARETAAAAIMARHWPPVGGRHDAALFLGAFLARSNIARDRVELFATAIAAAAGADAAHTERCAKDSAAAYDAGRAVYGFTHFKEIFGERVAKKCAELLKYESPPPANSKSDGSSKLPNIRVTEKISDVATQAENVLRESGSPLYQRGGALVCPVVEEVSTSQGRRTTTTRLRNVDAVNLRDMMDRAANFSKVDGRSGRERPITPPLDVAATLLARGADERKFPVVSGIISAPTLRPDGSVLAEPGYDPETKLLVSYDFSMPSIPEAPTKDDARRGLALFDELLGEFPLNDDVSRAVAYSAIITPVARGAFDAAPMHVARSPTPGSGKSFLLDVVSSVAIGQAMPVMSTGANQEETEKRLEAAVLTGQALISIDNVTGDIGGATLCQLISQPTIDFRPLGGSGWMRIETRGTTMYCNGNNIRLKGDICRRAITALLDAKIERPEMRTFTGDPVGRVLNDRGAYVAAALIICRAYIVAGRPGRLQLASFNGWSELVRSALIWLGKADCVASMETARGEDPELTMLGDVLRAVQGEVGVGWSYRFSLKELLRRGQESPGDLMDALEALAGPRGDRITLPRLGRWAQSVKNRIVDDHYLTNKPNRKGGSEWWVEHKNRDETPPSRAPDQHTFESRIEDETDKAVMVDGIWFPKSAIKMTDQQDGRVLVTVSDRLMKKKGLLPV